MTKQKKHIVLFGAGRSSYYILEFFSQYVKDGTYDFTIVSNEELSSTYVSQFLNIKGFKLVQLDIAEVSKVDEIIKSSTLVISMLPASLHIKLTSFCLAHQKSLFTASYVSDEMKALDSEVIKLGLLFLNECGLDPGLDHLSAKKIIDEVEEQGGKVIGFESFTGGLIAPESDDNPWGYKITWNPKNVVLAGQGGSAKFYQKGTLKYIPYQKLFRRTEVITVPGFGRFEGYANRDSTKYKEIYDLKNAETVFRGTLRKVGFCKAWDKLIQLGYTDDTYRIEGSENMTFREFTNLFLAYNISDTVEMKLQRYLNIAQDDFEIWNRIEYLGLFSTEKIGIKNATPAEVLQKMVEKNLKLAPTDKDMIVMHHIFECEFNGEIQKKTSSIVVIGENTFKTAMAKTVGLPLAIAAHKYLSGEIKSVGVKIPVDKEIYLPILSELKSKYQIEFIEEN